MKADGINGDNPHLSLCRAPLSSNLAEGPPVRAEHLQAALVIQLPLIGNLQRPVAAVEQFDPENLLEVRDLLAGCGLRDGESLSAF